ncbi:MAG: DHH family phosphoesterase [Lachnospiraceae bacterium]|nr:DHH family phosphoesterase [Lachnospiraceae bacterium]MBP5600781.1 DHH family phosphoesterase [Lachnospiraceae bacterium]
MKNKIKIKGKMRFYLWSAMALGLVLVLIDIYLYTIDVTAGFAVNAFLVLYFAVTLLHLFRGSNMIVYELINFATQYGQIQKQLLKSLDIPHALLDENGKVIWSNNAFERVVGKDAERNKSIYSIIPAITKDKLPGSEVDFLENEFEIQYNGGEYLTKLKKISLKELIDTNNLLETEENYEGFLVALYLFDNTALKLALKEVDDQSLAVGLVYIDNYEEALESVEEVRRSLLTALIERKINKYMASLDGITKKIEKDKYMVILRKSCVAQLKENKFDLLEDVKTVNIGNEMAVTLSIGVGLDGLSYAQNYEFARAAIDMALGRGGDQAVVKTPEQLSYFGGKSQQVEKNTRVKARVKAHALMEIISSKDQVFVMGHRNGDVDSFGAAVGIYRIAKTLEKKAHIVVDNVTPSMKPLVDLFVNNQEYEQDMIVGSQKALNEIGNNAVLVIVDVNRPSLTECPDLFGKCKSIVVLDHHRQSAEPIENATLSYVEPYASSTCEMVSEILQYTTDNVKIRQEEADSMYAGIIVDTDGFLQKTGVRTFEAAAFLRRNGADVTRVRKRFREDVNDYKARADAVSQAEIYKNDFAISVCEADDCEMPTVVGAQAANELLNIRGVKASFVFTYYDSKVYISARSIDEVNVQVIMERMGGGGHMNAAATQLEGTTIMDSIDYLKEMLDKMLDEGEI